MILYVLTVFLGAFLLFLVQPLLAAFILPWFGGAPAVWAAAMLFFQVLLLGGYAYAHGLARTSARFQGAVHLALLALTLIWLPILPDAAARPTEPSAPVLRILGLLFGAVGLPYLALAATSTLLQAWTQRRTPASPWRLYAWSNTGSLLALLAWPVGFEPLLGAHDRAWAWSGAYVVFALLMGLCTVGWLRSGLPAPAPETLGPPPPWRRQLLWVALTACASALLLAVTDAITTDVSVMPLFWLVPLGLYLTTFIITFARDALPSPRVVAAALVLGVAALALMPIWRTAPVLTRLGVYSAGLFLCCLALHAELVRTRPPAARLTRFYLMMALGGALGGALVALGAPALLSGRYELPILLVMATLLFGLAYPRIWTLGLLVPLAAALTGFVAWPTSQGEVLARTRSFYGVLTLERRESSEGPVLHLLDGRVSHGFQVLRRPTEPTHYFQRDAGVARAFDRPGPRHVGLIGLGAGTLAAYGRPGDTFRIYELNPDVVGIARDRFTYLSQSAAKIEIVLGDARLSLAREPSQRFDVLVCDAFSGDSVPRHLLTVEAFRLYRRHLAPDGVLAVHVSNHHLDLAGVVYRIAAELDWPCTWLRSWTGAPLGHWTTQWMLLGPRAFFDQAGLPLHPPPSVDEGRRMPLWTDDYTPLWPVLR